MKNEIARCKKKGLQIHWPDFIYNMKVKNQIARCKKKGLQIHWLIFIYNMKLKERKGKKKNQHIHWPSFVLYMKLKKRNSWMVKKESAKALTHFSLYMKQTRSMRSLYNDFCTDSADSTMVLFLEDDVVMKRLFG